MIRAIAVTLFVMGAPFVIAMSMAKELWRGVQMACLAARTEMASFKPTLRRILEHTQ